MTQPTSQPQDPTSTQNAPTGGVQGLCTASIGLFTVIVAFVGYTSFNVKSVNSAWQLSDATHLFFALLAACALAGASVYATKPAPADDPSAYQIAHTLLISGSVLAIVSISSYFLLGVFWPHR